MDRLKRELALLKTSRPLVCQYTTRSIFLLDLPSKDYLRALPVCCCCALQPQCEHCGQCGSVSCGLSSVMYHGWEGKCSEKLATPSYSKNPRVNKDI